MTESDSAVAQMVSSFFGANAEAPTLDKITACFNISLGLFRACCVRGSKRDVLRLANQFHKGLVKEINSLYEDR